MCMRRRRFGSVHFALVVSALFVLLVILAGLQWKWVDEMSRADVRRRRETMQVVAGRFAADVDRELTRAYLYFHPDPGRDSESLGAALEERFVAWKADAPHPRIVREIYLAVQADRNTRVFHLAYDSENFEAAEWPADLSAIGRGLERRVNLRTWMSTRATVGPPNPLRAEIPALVIPLVQRPLRPVRGGAHFPGRVVQINAVVLKLDLDYLQNHFLPSLLDESFSSANGLGYHLSIRERRDPHRVIFETDPRRNSEDKEAADLELGLFSVRPFAELRGMGFQARRLMGAQFGRLASGRPPGRRGLPLGGQERRAHFDAEAARRVGEGAWLMRVQHRAGSLEQVVRSTRRRNLSVSFGILGLLTASLVVLLVMTRRTQALAQQQIDFVAGISHELHTPLAAIRSAGENLADGVVEEEQNVRRYGRMIASEGRRLSHLLANVLEYAGMQSGTRSRPMDAQLVEEIIATALKAESGLIEAARVQVETDLELPATMIVADQAALQSAVQNLIENAVKYGGPGRRVLVSARVTEVPGGSETGSGAGSEVSISVQDEGPGVPAEDLPRIFAPFFRGASAAVGPIPGSGLGLSVVKQIAEAHGGRVTVGSGKGGMGSVFTLHLPLGERSPGRSRSKLGPKRES